MAVFIWRPHAGLGFYTSIIQVKFIPGEWYWFYSSGWIRVVYWILSEVTLFDAI